MIVLAESDGRLVTRLLQRLMSGGVEVYLLRTGLLKALIGAAHLAGDKDEARELAAQLEQLVLERAPAPYSRQG